MRAVDVGCHGGGGVDVSAPPPALYSSMVTLILVFSSLFFSPVLSV